MEDSIVNENQLKLEVLEEMMLDAIHTMKSYAEKGDQRLTPLHARVAQLENDMEEVKSAQTDLSEDFCHMAEDLESVTAVIEGCREDSVVATESVLSDTLEVEETPRMPAVTEHRRPAVPMVIMDGPPHLAAFQPELTGKRFHFSKVY